MYKAHVSLRSKLIFEIVICCSLAISAKAGNPGISWMEINDRRRGARIWSRSSAAASTSALLVRCAQRCLGIPRTRNSRFHSARARFRRVIAGKTSNGKHRGISSTAES